MHRHRAVLAIALLAGLAALARPAAAEEIWQVRSGLTSFCFNVELLEDLGIGVEADQPEVLPPIDPFMEQPNWSFRVSDASDLTFRVDAGMVLPSGLVEGAIRHHGAMSFTDLESGQSVTAAGLEIAFIRPDVYRPTRGEDLNPLYIRAQDGTIVFDVAHAMFHLAEADKLDIFYMNLRISEDWAMNLGRPDLAGWVVGIAELRADIEYLSGFSDRSFYVPNFGGGILDVKLGLLDSIQQVGHVGTFPSGTVALAMATTSCNVGEVDVPWLAPMQEDHPLIHMALYRLLDGKFEQLGVSWLKHGFFALSNSQCTPCQHPSNGTFLGVGCSDTYGVFNNSDRRYLGPRDEVDPFAGTWECIGSHFADGFPDCQRRHGGNTVHGTLDHRLVVEDEELDNAGAEYFYEAYYIVRADDFRDNNWGSKAVTMSWSGSTWDFNDAGPLVAGPAMYRWGDQRTDIQVPDDGKVVLAAQTTDLGGGVYNYEYALLNYDSDREIRSFILPVAGIANLTNIGFHDADSDATNDWKVTVEDGILRWETETHAQNPDANALTFGEMFNFRFDADAQPVGVEATLGLFMPGAGETVTGATTGPLNGTTGVAESATSPAALALRLTNRPNPVSPRTTLFFDLSRRSAVSLAIYDASGRMVKSLVDYTMLPGSHEIEWDGTGEKGKPVASGVYYANLKIGDEVTVRPMVVVR